MPVMFPGYPCHLLGHRGKALAAHLAYDAQLLGIPMRHEEEERQEQCICRLAWGASPLPVWYQSRKWSQEHLTAAVTYLRAACTSDAPWWSPRPACLPSSREGGVRQGSWVSWRGHGGQRSLFSPCLMLQVCFWAAGSKGCESKATLAAIVKKLTTTWTAHIVTHCMALETLENGWKHVSFLEELEGCSGALAPPACLTALGCGGRRQLWQWETRVAKINSELQPWLGSSWDRGSLCLGQ